MKISLTFISGNRVKLAHLRLLAKRQGWRIYGFRERTYYASYDEPRLTDRASLLEASYTSAVGQWTRAGLSLNNFFFFEDTSVRIEALSTNETEQPGVEVKYWMRSTSFEELDRLLKTSENNRSATVRSHIVLHIPPRLRLALADGASYLVFEGQVHGRIIPAEYQFSTNPCFPWLDNQSFNKWFIPSGSGLPLGALDLTESLNFDFRKRSLEKVLGFLDSHGYRSQVNYTAKNWGRQISFAFGNEQFPSVLFCAPTCAGKTTVAAHLRDQFGYVHVEASDFMRLAYYERNGVDSTVELGSFATTALKYEPDIVASQAVELIQRFSDCPIVLTGFRSPDELIWFKRRYLDRELQCIYVQAAPEHRLARAINRGRPGDPVSMAELIRKDKQQFDMGLEYIHSELADSILPNDSTVNDLNKTAETLLGLSKSRTEEPYASKLRFSKALGTVETMVIRALGDSQTTGAISVGLTSTDIAREINALNYRSFYTKKDNISRFLTQRFSPFLKVNEYTDRSEFSLNQTGLSAYYHLKSIAV